MSITRLGTTRRWSDQVIHQGVVYTVEVAASADAGIEIQTREVLSQLAAGLEKAGSAPSRLLSVTIWLADMDDLPAFNAIWDEWVPEGCAPSRACVQARLAHPGYRVEIQATAACF